MNKRRAWDVTVVWCCALNVQSFVVLPMNAWGAWGWFIVVTGIAIIAGKYVQRDAF